MAKRFERPFIESCACFNVRRAARAITQFFDAEMRSHGVRATQSPILGALGAKDGWSMAELSELLGMERTTLVRNLRPLERDGLVLASGGGRGGHVKLSITEQGRAALAEMLPAWRSAQEKVLATLGEARWKGILKDLNEAAEKLRT